jgi:hypothetical protein
MRTFVSKRPFLSFFILAVLIPVVLVGMLLVFPQFFEAIYGGPVNIDQMILRAAAEAGVNFGPGSNFLTTFIQLCLVEPLLWLLVLGGAAPTLAGFIVAWARSGWRGVRDILIRLRPWLGAAGPRQALRAYALLAFVMIAAELAVYATRYGLGGEIRATYTFPENFFSLSLAGGLLLSAFLDQGSFLEEPGWRGFAQPLLQARMQSPLAASLVLGVAWSLWHLPRDVGFGTVEALGAARYALVYLPAFTANCVLVSIVATYFYNLTGGSVIPALMVHGLANDAVGLAGLSSGVTFTPSHQLTKLGPYLLLVLVLLLVKGRSLGAAASESQVQNDPERVPGSLAPRAADASG